MDEDDAEYHGDCHCGGELFWDEQAGELFCTDPNCPYE